MIVCLLTIGAGAVVYGVYKFWRAPMDYTWDDKDKVDEYGYTTDFSSTHSAHP